MFCITPLYIISAECQGVFSIFLGFYCKTSAPKKPTKQANNSKTKNVISTSSFIIYISAEVNTKLNKKTKKEGKNPAGAPRIASLSTPLHRVIRYLYAAITVTAKETQPAESPKNKIDFNVSLIFSFPLFNIF